MITSRNRLVAIVLLVLTALGIITLLPVRIFFYMIVAIIITGILMTFSNRK